MFLHGELGTPARQRLFFWVFGNNVEDSMGRARFLVFYLLCGFAAAGAHVLFDPGLTGSDGRRIGSDFRRPGRVPAALSAGAREDALPIFIIFMDRSRFARGLCWLCWFVWQVMSGLPQLTQLRTRGFRRRGGVGARRWLRAGMLLVHLFENPRLVERRTMVSDARGAFAPES